MLKILESKGYSIVERFSAGGEKPLRRLFFSQKVKSVFIEILKSLIFINSIRFVRLVLN
jgi:hypothetical protein